MYHNMAVLKCRISRGYTPETQQVVALETYNLASWYSERGLQGLHSVGQDVIVLSAQLIGCAECYAETKTEKCL